MGEEKGEAMQMEDTSSVLELKVLLVGAPESVSEHPSRGALLFCLTAVLVVADSRTSTYDSWMPRYSSSLAFQ